MLRYIFTLLFALTTFINAQSTIIKGTVKDKTTQTPLTNVNVFSDDFSLGTTTNADGKFVFKNIFPGNTITLNFSHLGYKISTQQVTVNSDEFDLLVEMSPASINMGEVTVSTNRYARILRETPLPLEIMKSETMEKRAQISAPDAVVSEPGVNLMRDGIWGTDINIRGLSRNNVVTLIDGNRIETATSIAAGLSLIDINDLERVEIMKGSASSLYGSGALGGVVNLITKSGSYASKLYMNGSISSSYNSVNSGGSGSLNLFMGSDMWNLKVTSTLRNALDTETPQGTLLNSRFHDNNVSAKLSLLLTDNNELQVNFQRSRATDVGIPGGAAFPTSADVRYPTEKRDLYSISYNMRNLSANLINLQLKYFYQYIFRDVENIPHTVKNIPAAGTTPPKRVSVLSITPSADHITNGAQLQSDWLFSNHYIAAGVDVWQRSYRGEREKVQKIEVLNPQTNAVVSTTDIIFGEKALPDADYLSMGIFLQDEIKLTNKLQLTLGGRVDKILINSDAAVNPVYQITNGVRNDTPPNQVILWDKTDANNFSWSTNINLLYKLDENLDLTLTTARSFRSPSLEERYQYIDLGSYVRVGDPNLEPENGYFADAGFRYWGSDITIKGNVFINSLNNLVVEKPGQYEGKEAFITTNIGKARLYGFDCGASYNLSDQLKMYSSLAYVRGEDTYTNTDLPQIPPFNGRIGFVYVLPELLEAELSANVFAAQNNIAEGEKSTPGYAVYDLYLSSQKIDIGYIHLNLHGGVENIFNKSYRNHLATNRSFINAEPGRNFFVKVIIGW